MLTLALSSAHDCKRGSPSDFAGTPRYLAPEQVYYNDISEGKRLGAYETKIASAGTPQTDVWQVA